MNKTSDEIEKRYWPDNQLIMGIDEVGRGPICGPLVVASCILPIGYENEDIYDSKKISPKKRAQLFKTIINDAIYYNFKIVEPKVIDELNIYRATQKAMEELALEKDVVVLTDAMPLNIDKKYYSLIKGDQKSINIAAASILAKVLRDHIMEGYHILYPQYELNKHKGYPTAKHLQLIKEYGINDIYRKSYGPCKRIIDQEFNLFNVG